MQPLKPLTISIQQFRDIVPVGKTTTFGLINDGVIRTVKVGRRTLLLFEDVERFVQQSASKRRS